ncbi:MAG: sel1 repeat family protein [Planctomycetes bacterium]|nr:sel1 repeat family protein [Planctomycetota bacterium]
MPAYPKAHGCLFSNSTFDYILKRAQQSYAFEQYGIGSWYANGINTTKDMNEAVKWYRKAAEQGNLSAQCNLGNCYLQGEGVTKDAAEAVKWYHKAAERDDYTSQLNLAYCHIEGKGVAEDETEGLAWLYIVNSREGRPYGGLLLSKIKFLENKIGNENVQAAKKRAEELKKMIETKKQGK